MSSVFSYIFLFPRKPKYPSPRRQSSNPNGTTTPAPGNQTDLQPCMSFEPFPKMMQAKTTRVWPVNYLTLLQITSPIKEPVEPEEQLFTIHSFQWTHKPPILPFKR